MVCASLEMKNLCTISDKNTTCELEYINYLNNETFQNNTHLNILQYNIDRNGYGESYEKGHRALIEKIIDITVKSSINVISLNEVGRNCISFGGINFADELSKALKWNVVYSVEYINSQYSEDECTVGNAILSSFPLTKYESKFFENQCCQYSHLGGARSFVQADIGIGDKIFKVVSTHLESGTYEIENIIGAFLIRHKQLAEIVSLLANEDSKTNASPFKYDDMFIIGDMNSPFMKFDYSLLPVLFWNDAFNNYSIFNRKTCPYANRVISNLDYIYSKRSIVDSAYVCDTVDCEGLSDHNPIIASYNLK